MILLWMFEKFHLWSHLVQDFCLLGVFFITDYVALVVVINQFRFCFFWIQSWKIMYFWECLHFFHLLTYNYLLYFLIIHSISVVTVVTVPHSFLILFICVFSLFFFLLGVVKGLSIFLLYSENQLFISLIVFFDSIIFIPLLSFLFLPSTLWALFVLLFLVPLGIMLGCLFEIFLISWGRPILLWISLSETRWLCPTDFRLLCFHFHLSQGIFDFSLDPVINPFIV